MKSSKHPPLSAVQNLFLLCITPLILAVWAFFYISRLDTVMHDELRRYLDGGAVQGTEIIQGRMQQRLKLLESLAAQKIIKDMDAPVSRKLDFLRQESERRGLVRMGWVNLQGKGSTTDGYEFAVGDRSYFEKAREGKSNISEILICRVLNFPIVVHTAPVRDHNGAVVAVLYATEKTAHLSTLLQTKFSYKNSGKSMLVDRNGVLLTDNSSVSFDFYADLAAQNGHPNAASIKASLEDSTLPLKPYILEGRPHFMRAIPIDDDSGWSLVLAMPEDIATAEFHNIINLTMGSMTLIVLLVLGCGGYMLALRRDYQRQRNVTDAALHARGVYYLRLNDEGLILESNASLHRRLGWPENHVDADRPLLLKDLTVGKDADGLAERLKESEAFMLRLIVRDGSYAYVQWHVLPAPCKGQHALLGTDFSARQQAVETQHAEATMRDFRQIFDCIPGHVALRDRRNKVHLVNRSLLDLLGRDSWRDNEKRFGGLVPDNEAAALDDAYQEVLRTGKSVSINHTIRDREGTVRHYRNTQSPLLDLEGNITSVVSLSLDITDSLRMEEHLTQELQRLRDLLDTSPVGVVISTNGLVSFCNLRARQMVGLEVGKPVRSDDLVVEGDPEQLIEKLKIIPIVRDMPIVVRDPRKRLRHLLVTATRTNLEGQQAFILWAVDVTPLKEIEKKLTQAKDAAEQATRAKSDFLATMSHEIRTPMNAVLGFLHLFERENLSPGQLDYLQKISISATGLLRIINDILDFSKIEAGKLVMENNAFSLVSSINAVHSIIDFSAKEKGLLLSTELDPQLPELIMGDAERLNQVLINLLNNAVKFTSQGFVKLRAFVRERHGDGSLLLGFTVSDSGIGMNAEQIDRIFQPFSQADSSVARRFGGTGLGLVISRRMVELMGGHIEVHSEEGKGTTFSFSIQSREGNGLVGQGGNFTGREGLSTEDDELLTSLAGAQLLVVEDNDINQEIAGAMLAQMGMEVDFAGDGMQALQMVQQKNYSIIFMDVQMPIMDGLEATRRIRAMSDTIPYFKSIPIIAMTANAMLDDRRRCLEAGMNAHIAKPIEPQALRKMLLQWLVTRQ